MNRKFRSFLSIFLSAAIAVTAIPLTAYAETEYFENAAETEEVVLVEESAADEGIDLTFEPQTASVKQEMKALTIDELAIYNGAAATSGSCAASGDGNTATWAVKGTVLTVSGNGDMIDYADTVTAMSSGWWAGNASAITEIVIGEGITSVGDYAFYYFTKLAKVTLPSTLKEIGAHAFDSCSALAEIKNNATSLTKIGDGALIYCSLIEEFEIPSTVTYIGAQAFYDLRKITEVTIPGGVGANLGARAFYGCSSLTTVTIEDGVTVIGDETFANCAAMTTITIPDTITTIGNKAFITCSSLVNINGDTDVFTVPASVTDIGEAAFSGCTSIKGLIANCGMLTMSKEAFASCTALTSVKITNKTGDSSTATTIGESVFSGCGKLTAVTFEGNITEIGKKAFFSSGIQTITFPDKLTTIGVEAFNATALKNVTFPASLTTINEKAFMNCASLESVTVANANRTTALNIGPNAFYRCVSLKTLNLSGTGVIRNNAFDGCTSLTTLTLPSTLSGASTSTNSFSNQFKDCTALETVVIEDGAAALGRTMFDGCEKLNSITVPASVTKTYGAFKDNEFITTAVLNNSEIGNNMFTNAISLSNLTLNGTETIGSNAFQGCAKLTKVTIPDTVDTIGSYAFEKCIGLRSFIFPEAVTVIPARVLADCTALKAVKIGTQVTRINGAAFGNCIELQAVTHDKNAVVTDTGATLNNQMLTGVTMPNTVTILEQEAFQCCYELKSVQLSTALTKIGIEAFLLCTGLTSLTIPAGVTVIPNSLIEGCENIKTVTVLGNVTEIGSKTFMGCKMLEGFIIPSGVTRIGAYAFSGCSLLDSAIPAGVTSLGNYAFENCIALGKTANIMIPTGVTKIGDGVFKGCKELKTPDAPPLIGNQITAIGNFAFSGCSNSGFNKLSIPASVTSVGSDAFSGCSSLATVSFATEGCKSLGSNAFANCSSLKTVGLPSTTLTSIGTDAFLNCRALTGITVPSTVTTIGSGAFESCTSLETITLSSLITKIDNELFKNCSSLKSVAIPEGVKSIGVNSFTGCTSLTSVDIPGTVTSLGKEAFMDCDALEYIVIPASITSFGTSTFANCDSLSTVIILSTANLSASSKFLDGSRRAIIYCYDTASAIITYATKNGIPYRDTLAGGDGIFVVILKHPEHITGATIGSTYEITAKVASEGRLSYEWWIMNPGAASFTKTDVTGDTYSVKLTEATDGIKIKYIVTVTSPDDPKITAKTDSEFAVISTFGVPAVSLTNALDSQVVIGWKAVNGASKYIVYRADTPASEKTLLGEVTDALTFTDDTVEPETTYYYYVAAYNSDLQIESCSAALKVTTPEVATTAYLTATPGNSKVVLKWTEVKNATKYRVRRYANGIWTNYADVTALTYTDSNVTNGTAYKYAVYAYINGAWAGASNIVTATPNAPVVNNVKATAGDGKITLTWDAVAGATLYRIRRYDGTWANYKDLNATSFVDTNVTNGKTYQYAIYAYVDGAWSKASAIVKAAPVAAVTVATNVKATPGDGVITLTWSAVAGAAKYKVRRTDGTGWVDYAEVTTNTLKDQNVVNGKKYYYAVYVHINGAWGKASDIVNAIPSVSVATNVKATAGDGKVTLTWTAAGATKFRIRRNDGTGWVNYKDVTATSFVDTNVTNGAKYYYAVYVNVNGAWGPASAVVNATPAAAVTVAQNVKATAGDGVVTVTWTAVNGASKYMIRRNDGTGWINYAETTTNSFEDVDVTNGMKYYYAVYVYANGSWGKASAIVNAVPADAVATNVVATATNGGINIKWTADGATTFRLRRNDGTGWVNYKDVTTNDFTDTNVVGGAKYYYAVYVYANGAWGKASAIVSATA